MRSHLFLLMTAVALGACQEAPSPKGASPEASAVAVESGGSGARPEVAEASDASRRGGEKGGGQASTATLQAMPEPARESAGALEDSVLAPNVISASASAPARDVPRTFAGAHSDLVRLRATALAAVPGEVLEVEIDEDDVPITYEFKILTSQGRVIELELDAQSGRILEQEAE